MFMFVVFILFMPHIKFSQCYGIELEGRIRVDKEALTKIKSDILLNKPDTLTKLSPLGLLPMPLHSKWLHPYNYFRRSTGNTSTQHVARRTLKNGGKSAATNFLIRLKMTGIETIKSVANYIKQQLDTKQDNSLIQDSIYNYVSKLNRSIDIMLKEKAYFDIDKEFLFINIIEIVDVLRKGETTKMFNKMIEKHNFIPSTEDLRIIMETINRKNAEDKKNDFEYICSRLDICRIYPGYIDYFADLTSEILKLSDHNLKLFVTALMDIINIEKDYIETVLDVDTARELGNRLDTLVQGDINTIRESVSVLRGIITHRHNFIKSQHSALKIKTKATRLLMDIIDKTFELGEEELATEYDLVTKAIRDWVAGFRNDIETILYRFLHYTVLTVKNQWDKVAREETKVLLEIILVGKSTNRDIHISLFTKGSNFVLGNSLIPTQ